MLFIQPKCFHKLSLDEKRSIVLITIDLFKKENPTLGIGFRKLIAMY